MVAKALTRLPADRWESAETFAQALLTATMDATPVARLELAHVLGGEGPEAPPGKWGPVRWALLGAVAVITAGVWLATRGTGDSDPSTAPASRPGPVETKLVVQGTLGENLQFGAGSYSISPDGELLAYCSQEEAEGVWRVWLADLTRPERPHKVLASGGPCEWLRWTPSGDRVLFYARLDGTSEYYAVSRHGGSAEPFTECPRDNDAFPFYTQLVHLSPDGSRRLFWRTDAKDFRIMPAGSCDLSAADSFLVRGDLPYQFPLAWSSRSDRLLVFEGDSRGTRQILSTFGLDEADQSALTTDAQAWPFWWSADERQIIYTRTGPWGSSPDIQRGPIQVMRLSVDASGEPEGQPREIAWFRDYPVDWFSISADGRRAVVARETNRYRILFAAPDPSSGDGSASVEPLTDVKAGETWYPFVLWGGSYSVHGIDLSRDGQWLLLPQSVPGGSDLFKVPIGGGAPIRLTRSGLVYGGLWSPDGRFAAFLSPEGDSVRIRLVSADGRSSGPIKDPANGNRLN